MIASKVEREKSPQGEYTLLISSVLSWGDSRVGVRFFFCTQYASFMARLIRRFLASV